MRLPRTEAVPEPVTLYRAVRRAVVDAVPNVVQQATAADHGSQRPDKDCGRHRGLRHCDLKEVNALLGNLQHSAPARRCLPKQPRPVHHARRRSHRSQICDRLELKNPKPPARQEGNQKKRLSMTNVFRVSVISFGSRDLLITLVRTQLVLPEIQKVRRKWGLFALL
jgi:hypothetical protein